ncbi:hypothetical protein [Nonomuraea sp. NPDC049129]|uniref:hypothetical protein n=1 Tax=Nonomuraea sp. NPDC049129 TaxID=3155272 RepID=UPI0033E64211
MIEGYPFDEPDFLDIECCDKTDCPGTCDYCGFSKCSKADDNNRCDGKGMCDMTITTTNLNELPSALAGLANVFGNVHVAHDTGCRFTCNEADSLAAVLVAAGYRDAAITWLEGHVIADEADDLHLDVDEGVDIDIPAYVDALVA